MNVLLHPEEAAPPAQPRPYAPDDRLAMLEGKLDSLALQMATLGAQLELLTAAAQDQRRRQQSWDELGADLLPIARDLYTVTAGQLEEIQAYVQIEDVLHLLKRLARNTRTFNEMLDQLESLQDFLRDFSPLTQQMVGQLVTLFDGLERKGYFGFAQEGLYVADKIVTSFRTEDVRLLGDNIVTILNTVKALTQPEIMQLVDNLTQGYQEAEAAPLSTSYMGLLGQMRDPEVRRGLALTMTLLKRVARQTPAVSART